jgi:hypothetical protein
LTAAVSVPLWLVETAATVAVKPALDWPAATITFAGIVTFALSLKRETGRAAGVGPLSVTVHVELPAAWKEFGAQPSELIWMGGITVTVATLLMPLSVPVTVTD